MIYGLSTLLLVQFGTLVNIITSVKAMPLFVAFARNWLSTRVGLGYSTNLLAQNSYFHFRRSWCLKCGREQTLLILSNPLIYSMEECIALKDKIEELVHATT